ncbi:hypothetical protein P3T76_013811 [Phytophthora citrophthora]|uniref:Uncharacterized protein n=1 Tax=Phytophthora citrophthora TaxID=4793 RepID=A0AAD9G2G7_9STRA|nr:hypothetical protein P3T76_013811 [Phytophthora citrophthora]
MNESQLTPRTTSILELMTAVQSDMKPYSLGHLELSDTSDSTVEPIKKKRVYKKRKPTHTLRKEEKLALQAEITALQSKLESLKIQALVKRGEEDTTLNAKVVHNTELRNVIQDQHLVMAHAQGMLLEYTQRDSYEVRPTEMFIHLMADRRERHETLKALREPKLYYARRYIQHRSMGMHPTAEYFHEERYETPEGDVCAVRFDRVPLRGVRGGIRAVLDALKHAAFNAEIIISENLGNLTIREDDDLTEEDCSQLRLVTQTNRGIIAENNLVHFTDFSHAGGEDNYAVTSTDFVDEDELYPYRPMERVRRDATAAILVTSHADPQVKTEEDGGNTSSEEEEPVIVITRWSFTRICHTELNISRQVLREMRDLSGKVSETILNCVCEAVGLPKQL